MPDIEVLVRNYNVIGVGRRLGFDISVEELEKVMKELGIPIVAEPRREQLLRSLEEWRRTEMGKEHLGNNRPKPVSEMLSQRRQALVSSVSGRDQGGTESL